MAITTSLFSALWGNLKDAATYVVSGGDKQYFIDCTIRFKSTAKADIDYWSSYASAFNNARPFGTFDQQDLGGVIRFAGIGTNAGTNGLRSRNPGESASEYYQKERVRGAKIFFDFIFQGYKAVFQFDPTIMEFTENRSAFLLSQTRADKLKEMKRAVENAVASLQQLSLKIDAGIKEYNKKPNPQTEEAKLLKSAITDYNTAAKSLNNDKDVQVYFVEITYPRGLGGLGAAPAMLIIAVVTIAAGVVAYATITQITNKIADYAKIKALADSKKAAFDAVAAIVTDPNVSQEQKDKVIDGTYGDGGVLDDISAEIKTQQEQSGKEDNLFSTIATVAKVSAIIGIVYGGVKLIPLFVSKKSA